MIEWFTGSSGRKGVYMLEQDFLARLVRNSDMYEYALLWIIKCLLLNPRGAPEKKRSSLWRSWLSAPIEIRLGVLICFILSIKGQLRGLRGAPRGGEFEIQRCWCIRVCFFPNHQRPIRITSLPAPPIPVMWVASFYETIFWDPRSKKPHTRHCQKLHKIPSQLRRLVSNIPTPHLISRSHE